MTAPAITVRGLTVRHGDVVAVDALDLDVPRGSVFGLVGRNGAGKTSTLRCLATLDRPTAGSVRVLGIDPGDDPYRVRARLGWLPDGPVGDPRATVSEHLAHVAALHRLPADEIGSRVALVLDLVGLSERHDQPVDHLSRGLAQALGLARALVHDPDVIVLDEPANGLDPSARARVRDLLAGLRRQDRTIVVSSHLLGELERTCDEVAVIDGGRLVATGAPADLADRHPGARTVRIRLAGGAERLVDVADEEDQQRLVRQLVERGEPVLEVARVDQDLESVFLRLVDDGGAGDGGRP